MGARLHSCFPTLAAETTASRGWGTHICREETGVIVALGGACFPTLAAKRRRKNGAPGFVPARIFAVEGQA